MGSFSRQLTLFVIFHNTYYATKIRFPNGHNHRILPECLGLFEAAFFRSCPATVEANDE